MVLLIDVGDFLFNFYQKNGVLSDKEAVDAFVDAYNKLSEIPHNILSKVRFKIPGSIIATCCYNPIKIAESF